MNTKDGINIFLLQLHVKMTFNIKGVCNGYDRNIVYEMKFLQK